MLCAASVVATVATVATGQPHLGVCACCLAYGGDKWHCPPGESWWHKAGQISQGDPHIAFPGTCMLLGGLCCACMLQTEMRTFFRRYFTHNRYVSATATPLEALQLNQGLGGVGSGAVDLSSLYIDMRPYMNRSPFTVRRDCSASRVHQVSNGGLLLLASLPQGQAMGLLLGCCCRRYLYRVDAPRSLRITLRAAMLMFSVWAACWQQAGVPCSPGVVAL